MPGSGPGPLGAGGVAAAALLVPAASCPSPSPSPQRRSPLSSGSFMDLRASVKYWIMPGCVALPSVVQGLPGGGAGSG